MILSWLVCDMLRQIPYAICFSHPIHSPITHKRFCTKAFTHNSFYTHRCCSTEGPLHRDSFTIKRLYTKKLWRTVKDPFPQEALQREAVTRSSFYTQTLLAQELLDTEAFTRRTFCTEKPLLRTNFATHLDVWHAWSPQSVSPSHLKRGLQELELQVFSHSLVGAQRSWSLTCPRRRWCKWGRKQCRCFVWVLKELIEADHLCICTCVDDV